MLRKLFGVTSALALTAAITVSAAEIGDIALYNANVGWIDGAKAKEIGDGLVANVKTGKSIKVYSAADLATFATANTSDGDVDVILLFGDLAETIYTPGNAQADNSIVEAFINGGNMVLNTADYIFYVNQGAGSNGDVGLKTITNSTFDMWTDGNMSVPTADGAKYTPSLVEFSAPRAWKKAQIEADGNWNIVAVLGASADGANLDPAVIQHKTTGGYVGSLIQVPDDAQPRQAVLTEFFNNWLPTIGSTTAVDPKAKLATTWASVKTR